MCFARMSDACNPCPETPTEGTVQQRPVPSGQSPQPLLRGVVRARRSRTRFARRRWWLLTGRGCEFSSTRWVLSRQLPAAAGTVLLLSTTTPAWGGLPSRRTRAGPQWPLSFAAGTSLTGPSSRNTAVGRSVASTTVGSETTQKSERCWRSWVSRWSPPHLVVRSLTAVSNGGWR